jgi:hypothetical protein
MADIGRLMPLAKTAIYMASAVFMVSNLERPDYRFRLVENGVRFYTEVRYRHLTARVGVYKSFNKTHGLLCSAK